MRWLGAWAALLSLALLAGCGGPEPIVGTWVGNQNAREVVMEFKPDHTMVMDTSKIEAELKSHGATPVVTQIIDKMHRVKTTWAKEGSLYRLQSSVDGKTGQPLYVKVEGKTMTPCAKDGTPTKGATLTRK
jgi:hypothetical protein